MESVRTDRFCKLAPSPQRNPTGVNWTANSRLRIHLVHVLDADVWSEGESAWAMKKGRAWPPGPELRANESSTTALGMLRLWKSASHERAPSKSFEDSRISSLGGSGRCLEGTWTQRARKIPTVTRQSPGSTRGQRRKLFQNALSIAHDVKQ
jgi:hypothetical protein